MKWLPRMLKVVLFAGAIASGLVCYDIGAKHGLDRGFNAGFGMANSTFSSEVEAAEIERYQALMDVGIDVMHHDNDPMIAAGFSPVGIGSMQCDRDSNCDPNEPKHPGWKTGARGEITWINAVTGKPRGTEPDRIDASPATCRHCHRHGTITYLGSNGASIVDIDLDTGHATLHGTPDEAAKAFWKAVERQHCEGKRE